MEISERRKRYGQGKTYVKTKKRLPINFDIASLDLMVQYVLTENRNIKRGSYINLRNLIELLDLDKVRSDQDKYRRVIFIKKALEAKLEKGLKNPLAIIKYANGGLVDSNILEMDTDNILEMSNSEIDWVNETVSNTLALTFLYEEVDIGIDLLTQFKAADAGNISRLGSEIEEWISNLNTMFRKSKVQSVTNETFSLKESLLYNKIMEIQDELKSEYRKLITGMQGLNQILGGGFENTRCYLFLGVAGIGKSLSLLNIALQIKKYNKNFKPKDPTKIPCIVYLTQENTVTESVDRLFKMSTGEDIRNFNTEDAVRMLKESGELYLTDESPIDIIIKYQPNRSVDTGYLYTLTEDLEDEGYEVICMIQDHVKRIRATTNQKDVRLELGDVINEMKTFAILKDIPIITVSHLNREGARVVDATQTRTNSDLTRLLGRSNIGESLLMLDNVDYAGIINKEYDTDGNPYMVFKNIKERFKVLRQYICQPFDVDNDLKLVEDYDLPIPVFKENLHEVKLKDRSNETTSPLSRYEKKLSDIDNDDNEESNIFEFEQKNRYSSINSDDLLDDLGEPNILLPEINEPINLVDIVERVELINLVEKIS